MNMYQAKSGVKNFSLYWGEGSPVEIFFQSEHVSSQSWCQKKNPFVKNISTRLHPYIHTDAIVTR